ncbi:adhesive plaque matrix protein-like [Spodoptera frugiperda]|uniref:Adhesive plaque matrix protein-like n=1 Tax=Spodoptera frugiperda TaxID=7108 RepID=A0A9R0E7C6_SPOFR|nr:adhesive plaque matrix protein-like [Spodoptera frugiperda]
MWSTLLAIIALCITISHSHDGSQNRNIVNSITGQEDTNRVRRFISAFQNTASLKRRYVAGYNQNTTQNYNNGKPGYNPYNVNPSTVKPLYPNPPGYNQYPGNYPVYPSPNPQQLPTPNTSWQRPAQNSSYPGFNNKPINTTYPGYSQYPANYSGYPAPQQNNNKPVYPTPPGYSQYPSNYSGYPVPQPPNRLPNPGNYSGYPAAYPQPSNMNPLYPTLPSYSQNPGNYSGYPARPNNIPTTNAPWARPAQNTTRPGYSKPVNYNKCSNNSTAGNDATSMDACLINAGYCPKGMIRMGEMCYENKDDEY